MTLSNFSEALKYLTDLGVMIAKLRECKKVHWAKCLGSYFTLMNKVISKQKMDPEILAEDFLSKFKPPFIDFYLSCYEDINMPILDDKPAVNDFWLKSSSVVAKETENVPSLNKIIYQCPNDEKLSSISLHITEIYENAILLHKEGHSSKELPFRVIYGIFNCIKFSCSDLDEYNPIIDENIAVLEAYGVEDDDPLDGDTGGFGSIEKIANQMMSSLGMDANSIPKDAFSKVDPNMVKTFGELAKGVMDNIKGTEDGGKPKNVGEIIKTVTDSLSKPEISQMFENFSASSDVLKTIPTKDTFAGK